ncbi:MAG: type II toxin-antitoxin system RelE/ParE family toxin [Pelatocladus maniniholoensis HA4357-MV3]|jgi:mRNA interferase RelE/StbE|uniref:Type II toxin-antitoxin system RelE/ParE family toxin n=1 Tax=Pelatocladus maniniholoensis HA4357-MV3 TaxID=1117104 RepID=A0A9E3H6Y1_9NOST|nr:type II toxin-antitoxin system RelE/ParE family toxin [Pelatocladus maniniholoensis HA4357-MV3]BAZ66046.1 plasmid stabilization system [Fischerella sp. NIES-4106]
MYEVVLSTEAQEVYASADQALAKKIAKCFAYLEQNPRFHPNIKALKGDLIGYYRYRIGYYRVVYQVDDNNSQVMITTIVHRRDAY